MKVDHDPRYSSKESKKTVEDDLNLCLKHNNFDGYID